MPELREGGQLIAEYKNSTTYFVHDNNIGTSTVLTSMSGGVSDCNALYPFGEQDNTICSTTNTTTHKFTGKERDTESNLDNFGARYYSSAQGRFITGDWSATPEPVPYADFSNPQSLNLYVYVGDNPLGRIDPDGHCCWDAMKASVSFLGQELVGVGKEAVNAVTSTINGISSIQNGVYVPGSGTNIPQLEPTNLGQSTGMGVAGAALLVSGAAEEEAPVVLQNAAKGRAFQDAVAAEKGLTNTNVVQNVTVKTQSGVKTVIDVVSRDNSGSVALTEAKSSASARLTPNQAAAHPEIGQTGATVVGRGKPGYPGGTKIPPTNVEVVRPKPDGQ